MKHSHQGTGSTAARPVDRRGETTLIAGLLAGLIAVATLVAALAGGAA